MLQSRFIGELFMKIKKNGDSLIRALKTVAERDAGVRPTFLSLDTRGNIVIEGFKKLIEYDNEKISLNAGAKNIYLYGESLKITACTKNSLSVYGAVSKIEIFEVK